MMFRNAQSTSNVIVLALAFVFISIFLFDSVSSSTEPFTITENTIYGFSENTVIVTITENLGKDQNIDISNLFIDHPLTDALEYSPILLKQSFSSDVFGFVDVSLGKYKTSDTIYWYDNDSVEHSRIVYLDDSGAEMLCDYVLGDKSCMSEEWAVVGSETLYDFRPLPTIKEKIVVDGLKIEQKESGIPLPANSVIQVKYFVKHPIPYGSDYSVRDTTYNKYDIKVCSEDGTECTILDPAWYSESWGFRRNITINSSTTLTDYQVAVNITYDSDMLSNFSDGRFTDENNVSMSYWLESKSDGVWAYYWVKTNLTTANGTQLMYYYGNPTATSESNGTATMIGFEDGVTNNLERTTVGTGSWSIVSGQRHGVSITTVGGYLMGLYDIPTSFYTETDVTQTADSSDSSNAYSLGLIDDSTFTTSETDAVFNPKKRFIITRYSPTYSQPNKFLVYYIDSSDTPHYWTGSAWGSATFVGSSGTYKTKMWADETNFYADILDSTGTSLFTSPASITKSSVKSFTNEYTMVSGDPYNNYYYLGMNYDNYILRQYTATEPTYSIGEEEAYNVAPNVTISSPENITYGTTSIALNWSANELISDAWYSINENYNLSIMQWSLNSSLYSNLPNVPNSEYSYYERDNNNYLIVGAWDGQIYGFKWNGTQWISDSSADSGLGLFYRYASSDVFLINDTYYAITLGQYDVTYTQFRGYNWSGSTWQSDDSIIEGLTNSTTLLLFSPEIFELDNELFLIYGSDTSSIYGFKWNGTQWISNSTIISGISTGSINNRFSFFDRWGKNYLFQGDQNGVIYGYNWSGSTWQSDSSVTDGLYDIGTNTAPELFFMNEKYNLLIGANSGLNVRGFDFNNINKSIIAYGGANNITIYAYDYLGAIGSATEYFYVDIYAPTVDAFYKWDYNNVSVNFTYSLDKSVTINWNVSDSAGINLSDCTIYYRNFDNTIQLPLFNYINGSKDPRQDANGYRNVSCSNVTINSTSERIYHNFTDKNKYMQYTASYDVDNFTTDGTYGIRGNNIVMSRYENHTTGANKTIKYNLQIDNSSVTTAPFLVTLCNKFADRTDWENDPQCLDVGAFSPITSIPDSMGYQNGITTTNGSGYLGAMLVTDIMYAIGSCPDCTNAENDWDASYTNVDNGYSFVSSTGVTVWNDAGWEFNTYANYFNDAQIEANLTVSDNFGNLLNDFQFNPYGDVPNEPPAIAIDTDTITGGLVTYYDIHGFSETGTIWLNSSVADNEGDSVNCTFYLLNNDTTMNTTLLVNYSVPSGFGTCPYEWNTTTLPDNDYRLLVSVKNGEDTTNRTSAGFIRIDNTVPSITISSPTNTTYNVTTIDVNVSADELIAEWYYSVNYSDWALFTPNTTLIGFEINDVYLLDILAIDFAGLNDTESVYFTINFTVGAYLRNLTCSSSDYHYISLNPLDDDDLRWSCELDTSESYYCMTHVYGNDEFNNKDEDKLLQTNPKRTTIKRYGIVDYFKSTGSYANVYFTDEKLMSESNYTYEVECVSSSGLYYGAFNKSVSIEYRKIANSMAFGVWSIDNMGYLLGVFFLIVILIILLSPGLKRR